MSIARPNCNHDNTAERSICWVCTDKKIRQECLSSINGVWLNLGWNPQVVQGFVYCCPDVMSKLLKAFQCIKVILDEHVPPCMHGEILEFVVFDARLLYLNRVRRLIKRLICLKQLSVQ